MTRRSYAGGKKGLRSRPCPWLSMVAPAYDQLTSWSIEAVAHGQLLDWAPLQLGEIGEELSSVRDWHLCLRRRPAARWRRGSRDDAAAIETRQALPHAGKSSFFPSCEISSGSFCCLFHTIGEHTSARGVCVLQSTQSAAPRRLGVGEQTQRPLHYWASGTADSRKRTALCGSLR